MEGPNPHTEMATFEGHTGEVYTKLFASWQHVVMRPYATITVATCDMAIGSK